MLRATKGGPTFKIIKPEEAENLNIELMAVITVSFRENNSFRPIQGYVYRTKFFEALKLLSSYDKEIERITDELKQDLARLAGPKGPTINLETLTEHVNEQLQKAFEKESLHCLFFSKEKGPWKRDDMPRTQARLLPFLPSQPAHSPLAFQRLRADGELPGIIGWVVECWQ